MPTFNGTIILKNNSTAGAIPANTSLSNGEIAINTKDGVIYSKTSDTGQIVTWTGQIASSNITGDYLVVAGGGSGGAG